MGDFFEILEKENSYRMILDAMYNGILVADKDCVVRYVNDSYTRLTGKMRKDVLNTSLMYMEGSRLPYTIETGKIQMRVERNSDNITYTVNMLPIKDDGIIVGGLSIIEDLTDLTRVEQERKKEKSKVEQLKKKVENMGSGLRYTFDDIIAEDERAGLAKKNAKRLSQSNMNILIFGESGTGKEMYAQSIHMDSPRRQERFLAINCATLDNNLLESELFGYVEGAFTGARKKGKKGMFEEADGGTLFLDEISELDYKLQPKLLRVLQEETIRPIGSSFEKHVDVRVIAATNKKLEDMVEEGKFRSDLYFRLSAITLTLPPLRECPGNIKPLLTKYLEMQMTKDKKRYYIPDNTLKLLEHYDWPGNVRELVNVIYVGAILSDAGCIAIENLPEKVRSSKQMETENTATTCEKTLSERVKGFEMEEIRKAIAMYGDTLEGKKAAAKYLGISLATLYNKTKEL